MEQSKKTSDKKTGILSALLLLIGAFIFAYTRSYDSNHQSHSNDYGKWIAIIFSFAALVILMPWKKYNK